MAIWDVQNVDPHTSWKHRTFQLGKDLCRSSSPTSPSKWFWFCNYKGCKYKAAQDLELQMDIKKYPTATSCIPVFKHP